MAIRAFSFQLTKHVSGVAAYILGGILYQRLKGTGAYLPISDAFWADMVEISAALVVVIVGYDVFVRAARRLTGCSGARTAEDFVSAP